MTRKDYALIAEAFSDHRTYARQHSGRAHLIELDALVYRMSEKLAQDNERFDKVNFLKACGVNVR